MQPLAAADIDHFGMGGGDRDVADRTRGRLIEDRRPGPAVIVGLPDAAVVDADEEDARPRWNADGADRPAGAVRANHPVAQVLVERGANTRGLSLPMGGGDAHSSGKRGEQNGASNLHSRPSSVDAVEYLTSGDCGTSHGVSHPASSRGAGMPGVSARRAPQDQGTRGFSPVSSHAIERHRDEPARVEFVHETADGERVAELAAADAHQLLDLHLADEVARAVGRLLKIQVLLAADRRAVEAQPAARRVGGGELGGLLEAELVRVHPQVADGARPPLREQHIDELPRAGPRVEHARLQHHLFPSGREALGAAVEEVVEQRHTPDRAQVRVVLHAREIEPVVPVRPHDHRVAVVDFCEELARARPETARCAREARAP